MTDVRIGAANATVASSSLTVNAQRRCDLGSGFVARWRELAAAAGSPNPFFDSWFLVPALALASSDVAVAAADLNGDLVGVLPLVRRNSYYGYPLPHLAVWVHDNAFCGLPLVRRGFEAAFWHGLFDWADRSPQSALFLHLPHLPSDTALFAALRAVVVADGRPAAVVQRSERALLFSDLSSDAYFQASISGKKRKELRRQHARLAELGDLAFERQEDEAGVPEWADAFLALELGGWKGREGSALACDPANATLFRQVLTGAAEAGNLERLTLTLDGKPIAMLANFLTPPGAYSFKTTYDERYARFSPGVLLQRENLALLGRESIQWADSCAAADHPMIERIWREKREMVHVSIAIGGKVRRAIASTILRAETGGRPEGI